MISLADLNTKNSFSSVRSEGVNKVSNPFHSSFAQALSQEGSIFSVSKDERKYETEQTVAYANPFSFQSLFGGNQNSSSNEVSAFDA